MFVFSVLKRFTAALKENKFVSIWDFGGLLETEAALQDSRFYYVCRIKI